MEKELIRIKSIVATALVILLIFSSAGCNGAAQEQVLESTSYADAKVSYLGPEGTYTHEACERFFSGEGEYIPYKTVKEAVEALVSGETEYAVIPQENTIGGAVTDYLDILIATEEVTVTGEVELPISQNLLVIPGTTLSDIRTVYSHKQGLTQGAEWLAANLPDAEIIEVSSTAEGARMVSEGGDLACAAIASSGCAEVYGLEILAAGIQNNDNNKTRFYVLSTNAPQIEAGDRMAFIVTGPACALPDLMSDIERRKLDLITIHDRPLKTELGQYCYVIECSPGSYEDYRKITGNSDFTFRFLGCFPER